MLIKIRDYIKQQKMVSLMQLGREFHVDEFALQPMLSFWVKKGIITLCEQPLTCKKTCGKCITNKQNYVYTYVE